MDEHRLKCFVAVYEQGTVSAAAVRLHMTQPPLSILLRKLEGELGVTLFERGGRRLVPTTTGELFYLHAKAQLANFETMRRELREAQQGSRGIVRVGCATAVSLFIMPTVMEALRRDGTDVTVHVQEGETAYMLQRLRERSLDLIISRSLYTSPELESTTVMDEPLLVALPPKHPLVGRRSIGFEGLRDERFLLHRPALGTGIADTVLRACQNAGYAPNVAYWGGETLPMLLMASKGLGIAFAPSSFASLEVSGLPALVPLDDPSLRTRLHVVWSRQHSLSPAAARLKNLVIDGFGTPTPSQPG